MSRFQKCCWMKSTPDAYICQCPDICKEDREVEPDCDVDCDYFDYRDDVEDPLRHLPEVD